MTTVAKQKEYYERVLRLVNEKLTLDEDIKALKDEMNEEVGKESTATIVKLANLTAKSKLASTIEDIKGLEALADDLGV